MHLSARRSLQLGLLFILCVLPAGALAIPTITCHCFTDRSFDPAQPAKADPYFLATTQNSFFAAAFGIDKKTVVMQKQKGTSGDELWIAYWLGTRTGTSPDALQKERAAQGSWQKAVTRLAIPVKAQGVQVAAVLKKNAPDERVSKAVVDDLLLAYRFHGEADLTALRKAGATNQEVILAGLLSARMRRPALELFREVKGGRASWGALLQRARIEPGAIQSEIVQLINASAAK